MKAKPWRTCTFEKLGPERRDYLDQLTREMIKKDFKPAEKNPFVWIEPDLVFKSPNKWMAGIRAVSVKEDLKVGLISGGDLQRLLLQYFVGLVLAMVLFAIAGFGFKTVGLTANVSASIALFISLTIMVLTAFSISLQRRTINQKVIKILIETAQSMGSNQITPFKNDFMD